MIKKLIFGIFFALPLASAAVTDIKAIKIPDTACLTILALGVVRIILHGLSPPTALAGFLACGVLIISLITDGIGCGNSE